MKVCKTCREAKPFDQYRIDKSCFDGLRSSCSTCLAAADNFAKSNKFEVAEMAAETAAEGDS